MNTVLSTNPGVAIIAIGIASIIGIILTMLGIFIIKGKGDHLIAGYNTASNEEKEKYNIERLRLITGSIAIAGGIYSVLLLLMGPNLVYMITITVVFLLINIVGIILANTWAKRKSQ